MKIPSMFMSVAVAGAFVLLLAVPSQAEDAKIPFVKGVRPEVQIARPSRVKGGDFDDKTQVVTPKIKLTNTTTQQGYIGYKAVFWMFNEHTRERGTFQVAQRHAFDVTLPPQQFMESEGASVTQQYDDTGYKFGFKYDGWVLQIKDAKGEIVLTKSTLPTLEKLSAELDKLLKEGQCYNRAWKPIPEPRYL
jgi:hypothetical protein